MNAQATALSMNENLIYDVGVHEGSDSAYYLSLGFRVVGIEASPVMVDLARQRFSREMATGQFTLLNVGLAAAVGRMDFWICDDVSAWSSFNRTIASRKGARHHLVTVDTRTFRAVLEEYGVPFYCKIDIEGNDRLCLEDLNPNDIPEFLSIEMAHNDGAKDLELLYALGYRKYKIISQVTWAQPLIPISHIEPGLHPKIRTLIQDLDRSLRGVTRDSSWEFAPGCSGAFGNKTQGRWVTYEKAYAMWQILHDADIKYEAKGIGVNWFDIHASLPARDD
jgi:FkbM family methyltransferase